MSNAMQKKQRIKKECIEAIFLMVTEKELSTKRFFAFFKHSLPKISYKIPFVIYFDKQLKPEQVNIINGFFARLNKRKKIINYEIAYKHHKADERIFDTTLHFLNLIKYKIETYKNILLIETDSLFLSDKWLDVLNEECQKRKRNLIITSRYPARSNLDYYNGLGIYKRTTKLISFLEDNMLRLLDAQRNYDYALSEIAQEKGFISYYSDSKYILDISHKNCIGEINHNSVKPEAVLAHTKAPLTIVLVVSNDTVSNLFKSLETLSTNVPFYEIVIYCLGNCKPMVENKLSHKRYSATIRCIPIDINIHQYLGEKLVMLNSFREVKTPFILFVKPGAIFPKEIYIYSLLSNNYRIIWPIKRFKYFSRIKNASKDLRGEEWLTKDVLYDFSSSHKDFMLATRDSLEKAYSRFITLCNISYTDYCLKKTSKLSIDVSALSKESPKNLSKVFKPLQWLGYFCFTYSQDYEFKISNIDNTGMIARKIDSAERDGKRHDFYQNKELAFLKKSIFENALLLLKDRKKACLIYASCFIATFSIIYLFYSLEYYLAVILIFAFMLTAIFISFIELYRRLKINIDNKLYILHRNQQELKTNK